MMWLGLMPLQRMEDGRKMRKVRLTFISTKVHGNPRHAILAGSSQGSSLLSPAVPPIWWSTLCAMTLNMAKVIATVSTPMCIVVHSLFCLNVNLVVYSLHHDVCLLCCFRPRRRLSPQMRAHGIGTLFPGGPLSPSLHGRSTILSICLLRSQHNVLFATMRRVWHLSQPDFPQIRTTRLVHLWISTQPPDSPPVSSRTLITVCIPLSFFSRKNERDG